MKSTYLLFSLFVLLSIGTNAQTLSITVTDDGKAMAYHDITVSHGDYVIGTGRTNARGFASIYVSNLRSKSIDVAGKYQNGGTKRDWSIKGKLKLDQSNSLHIRLEKIGEDIEKSRAEIKQRQKEMADKMKNRFPKRKSAFDDKDRDSFFDDDDEGKEPIQKTTIPDNKVTPNTSSNGNFNTQLAKIKNTRSSFDKEDLAVNLVKSNKLNTNQIKQIMAEISSSFSQKEVAIAAYPNCTDKNNYQSIINTFKSPFMKEDVKEATIDK